VEGCPLSFRFCCDGNTAEFRQKSEHAFFFQTVFDLFELDAAFVFVPAQFDIVFFVQAKRAGIVEITVLYFILFAAFSAPPACHCPKTAHHTSILYCLLLIQMIIALQQPEFNPPLPCGAGFPALYFRSERKSLLHAGLRVLPKKCKEI
jgi:hypothetical protein